MGWHAGSKFYYLREDNWDFLQGSSFSLLWYSAFRLSSFATIKNLIVHRHNTVTTVDHEHIRLT